VKRAAPDTGRHCRRGGFRGVDGGENRSDTFEHFGDARRRESEKEDAGGIDAGGDEVGHAMGEGVSLASSGAGDDDKGESPKVAAERC